MNPRSVGRLEEFVEEIRDGRLEREKFRRWARTVLSPSLDSLVEALADAMFAALARVHEQARDARRREQRLSDARVPERPESQAEEDRKEFLRLLGMTLRDWDLT